MEELGFDRFEAPMVFQVGMDQSTMTHSWSCRGYLVVLVNRGHLHCARQCRNRFPTKWFIPYERLIGRFWPGEVVPYPLEANDIAHMVYFIESRTGARVLSCDTGVGYSQQLTVLVQMMSGRVLDAREGLWAVPDAIRRRLEFRYGFPIEQQRFVVGLQELVGDVTLWDQGVRPDTTIFLVLSRPRNDA
jgi:hypothetical protein